MMRSEFSNLTSTLSLTHMDVGWDLNLKISPISVSLSVSLSLSASLSLSLSLSERARVCLHLSKSEWVQKGEGDLQFHQRGQTIVAWVLINCRLLTVCPTCSSLLAPCACWRQVTGALPVMYVYVHT